MAEIIPVYLGNEELLAKRKVAFLAPSRIAPLAVLPTYDWASQAAGRGDVIVSGFSSALEKDVWRIAAESGGSLILVLVRQPFQKTPPEYASLISQGRLLIVFLGIASRLDRRVAARRNAYVCSMADSIVFPSITPDSSLYPLLLQNQHYKQVKILSSSSSQ